MLPFMCFKIEPSENKFHHQGLSYTKLCGGVYVCVSTCVRVCAQVCEQVFGALTSKEFGHMVVNTYTQRKRERDRQIESEPRKDCVRLQGRAKKKCRLLSAEAAGNAV